MDNHGAMGNLIGESWGICILYLYIYIYVICYYHIILKYSVLCYIYTTDD